MFQRIRVTKMAAVVVLAGAGMLLFATLAGSSVEARGGSTNNNHGGKGGGTTTGTATCAVTPNPATLYTQVTISGSGFAPDTSYGFSVANSSGSAYMGFVASDSAGIISMTYNTVWTGTNTVDVSGGGIAATCSFDVK